MMPAPDERVTLNLFQGLSVGWTSLQIIQMLKRFQHDAYI